MKYNNKKTTIDGIAFDSKKEAARYAELKLLERGGHIHTLELQPRFELQEGFKKDGKAHRKIEYVADFTYFDTLVAEQVVEDVKGMKTEVYKLKKKLFLKKFPNIHFLET